MQASRFLATLAAILVLLAVLAMEITRQSRDSAGRGRPAVAGSQLR